MRHACFYILVTSGPWGDIYFLVRYLFSFGLDKCQVPTKKALSFPSSAGQGKGNMMNGSGVEIRTGRDHSPITVTGKTD